MSTGTLVGMVFLAVALAAVATPVARSLATRFGVVDQPAPRKPHQAPIPLLGGLAIAVAAVGSLVMYRERQELVQLGGLVGGATWVALWGALDDVVGLRVATKLLAQVVGALALVAAGIQVRLPLPPWLNLLLTVLWVVGVTNAFNLLDNMDGLSSGIGSVAAGCFLLLAVLNGQVLVATLAAGLLGACLGFLLYNFNPATIFMGDAGSMFLGFMMSGLAIKMRFPGSVPWITWMVPLLVLGLPIFDTTLVVVSRLRRGENPLTTPGQDHVSHRLLQLGWTPREVVLLLYLAGCALGGLAIFVSMASLLAAYSVAILVAVAAAAALLWLERSWPAAAGGRSA